MSNNQNHDEQIPPGMSQEIWNSLTKEVKDTIKPPGITFHEVDISEFKFPPPPTRDEAADELKHAYARGRTFLAGISARLGVLA
jgi:hypothetical protein